MSSALQRLDENYVNREGVLLRYPSDGRPLPAAANPIQSDRLRIAAKEVKLLYVLTEYLDISDAGRSLIIDKLATIDRALKAEA